MGIKINIEIEKADVVKHLEIEAVGRDGVAEIILMLLEFKAIQKDIFSKFPTGIGQQVEGIVSETFEEYYQGSDNK